MRHSAAYKSFIFLIMLSFIMAPFVPTSVISAAIPSQTSGLSLSVSSAHTGYSNPVGVAATLSDSVDGVFSNPTVVTVHDGNGLKVADAANETFVSNTSVTFDINPGLGAGSYEIRFLRSDNSTFSAVFSVVTPGISSITASSGTTAAPNSIPLGYSSNVTITVNGTNTSFTAGSTAVSVLKAGDLSNTNKALTPTIVNGTQLTFPVSAGLEAGSYTVRVSTPGKETVDGTLAVRVPSVTLAPASASAGYNAAVSVSAAGTNTGFASNVTSVSLLDGSGSSAGAISAPTVSGNTALTFLIPTGLTAGTYTVRLTTDQEVVSSTFQVVSPSIVSLKENGQPLGTITTGYLAKTIVAAGQSMNFDSSTVAALKKGSEDFSNNVVINSSKTTANSVEFTLSAGLPAGTYTLKLETAGVSAETSIVVVEGTISYGNSLSSPMSKDYIADKTVSITAVNTAFSDNVTTVSLKNIGTGSSQALTAQNVTSTGLTTILPKGLAAGTYQFCTGTNGLEYCTSAFTLTEAAASANPSTISTNISNDTTIAITGTNTNFTAGGATSAKLFNGAAEVTGVVQSLSVSGTASAAVVLKSSQALAAGGYKLQLRTENGNIDEVVEIPITAASVLPSAPTVVAPSAPITTGDETPDIVVRAEAGFIIEVWEGTDVVGAGTGAGAADVTITLNALAEGTHDLTVTAKDAQNNKSAAAAIPAITVDLTAPTAPEVDTAKLITNTPVIRVKAENHSVIRVYSGDVEVGAGQGAGDNWTELALSLTVEGTCDISITATDAAGNVSNAAAVQWTLDQTAPLQPVIVKPEKELKVAPGKVTISVQAEAGSLVSILDGSQVLGTAAADSQGAASVTLTLSEGSYQLKAAATDLAGNTGEAADIPKITVTAAGGGPVIILPPDTGTPPADTSTVPDAPPVTAPVPAPGDLELKATPVTEDGKSIDVVSLDAQQLKEALQSADENKLVLQVSGQSETTKVELSGEMLMDAASAKPDAVLSFQTEAAVYDLPVNALDMDILSGQLGADAKDVKVNVTIERVSGQTADQISNQAASQGLTLLTSAVDFSISVEANGRKTSVKEFGVYVSRTIAIGKQVDSSKATGVLYDPATGKFTFVPAVFRAVDGRTEATLKRSGNSIYTVMEFSKTFGDLAGHWSKQDVELLASKLVVDGIQEDAYMPDENITRAQFAALLVRALGLAENKQADSFSDVKADDWYSGTVGAAVQAGLVEGYEDDSFKPGQPITREQMAVMISRALKAAGKTVDAGAKQGQILSRFADQSSISPWFAKEVAQSIEAGIIQGKTDSSFEPKAYATRAEAAVMLKRMLQYAEFMN